MHHDDPRASRRVLIGGLATVSLLLAGLLGGSAVSAQEPDASPAQEADTSPAAVSIDGTWSLDTSIGDFADFSNAWVGFRVAEVLSNIGEAEAIGRTPAVSGRLTVSGSTIEDAFIEADLTAIKSDQSRRDPAIQRALETSQFPAATFQSTEAVDLGAVPAEGETFTASVPGTLTIHGVAQDVVLELTAQRVGDVVAVVGSLPLDFTAYGVEMPTAPIVVSVEENGDLEWQLFFRREA